MQRVLVVTFVLVSVFLVLPATAELRPTGPAFLLAPRTLSEGLDAAGNSVVVFLDTEGDGWVRRVDRSGHTRGADTRVASCSEFFLFASVAVAPQGHFAVNWACYYWPEPGETGGCTLFDADGVPVASVSGYDTFCDAAADGGGNFVLAWQSYWPSRSGVHIEVLDRSANVRVPPFTLLGTDPEPELDGLFADEAGRFTVLWTEGPRRVGQRFDPSGRPLGGLFEVPHPAPEDDLTFAMSPAGDLLFAWTEYDPGGGPAKILAQRYGPDWTPASAPFEVALTPVGHVSLALDASGAFVIATSTFDGGETGTWRLHARRFLPDGTPDGMPVIQNTRSTFHTSARVLATPRGDVTLFWAGLVEHDTAAFARPYAPMVKGDFDRDLKTDLVLRHAESGATRLWTLVDGTRTANLPVWRDTPDTEWTLAGVDDFSGDGRQDFVFRNGTTGEVLFVVLGGASGNEIVGAAPLGGAPTLSLDWEIVAAGDFDRDGSADLLWRNRLTGALVVWTLSGFSRVGTLVPTPDHAADANWQVVGAADWNGDGTRDLLWYNAVSGRLVQWLLDSDLVRIEGRFTNPPQADDANWRVVAVGDYGVGPGGGLATNDVVWRHEVNGRQVIWFLDHAGNRTAGIFTTPAAPSDPVWVACGPR